MKNAKKAFAYFAGLIVLFIFASALLGEYFSSLTGVLFYAAGIGASILIDKYIE